MQLLTVNIPPLFGCYERGGGAGVTHVGRSCVSTDPTSMLGDNCDITGQLATIRVNTAAAPISTELPLIVLLVILTIPEKFDTPGPELSLITQLSISVSKPAG